MKHPPGSVAGKGRVLEVLSPIRLKLPPVMEQDGAFTPTRFDQPPPMKLFPGGISLTKIVFEVPSVMSWETGCASPRVSPPMKFDQPPVITERTEPSARICCVPPPMKEPAELGPITLVAPPPMAEAPEVSPMPLARPPLTDAAVTLD